MTLWSLLFEPFADYAFMRRALVACFAGLRRDDALGMVVVRVGASL